MLKIHPLILLQSKQIINSLSKWAFSDSPGVHITEGKKSRLFVMLPYKHHTALSEKLRSASSTDYLL